MSGASMTMRVALLLVVSIGGGFGIGHLPRQYQVRAVLAAICLIVLLMTAGCATFTERDAVNVGEGAWQAGHLVDVMQTYHGAAEDPCYAEGDPITRRLIGRKPSRAGVIAWGAAYSAVHFGIRQALLDTGHEHWASAFELLSVVQQIRIDAHNVSVGIRIGAPNTVQPHGDVELPPNRKTRELNQETCQ